MARLSAKTRIRHALGARNLDRLRILRRASAEIKQTFARPTGRTVELEEIRAAFERLEVGEGDVLHVHSSMTNLLGQGTKRAPDPGSTLRYARSLLDLLLELVGETGTLLMPTQSVQGYQGFSHRGDVFDYETMPSRWGILTELFRRLPETVRSIHPHYNVSAHGPLARELISGHAQSEPYTMDEHSPWFRINEFGGKVMLLGLDFEVNSPIHVVEYVHHAEYPRPLYYDKPFPFRTRTWDGDVRTMEVALHAVALPDWVLPSFCGEYLQDKYDLYSTVPLQDTKVVVYRAADQYRAMYEEMQNDVCWYDAQYW